MNEPACATSEHPPETWDVDISGEGRKAKVNRLAQAIAVCQTCPMLEDCGELADERYDIGVWGGRYRPWNPARVPIVLGHDAA